jgi:hypothetical protein
VQAYPVAWTSFIKAKGSANCNFDQKKRRNFQLHFISSILGHQNPGSEFKPDPYPYPGSLEMLDPDSHPDSMNPDPQH